MLSHQAMRVLARGVPLRSVIGRRHMGIMDRVKSAFDTTRVKNTIESVRQDKTEKKRVEMYQAQLEAMAKMETYTLRDYVNNLTEVAEKSGLNDWRSWLRTKAQQAELDEQWLDLKIAQALEPAELADPSLLRRREKIRVSMTAGCDVSRINRFLDNFDQSRQVHKWMQSRKARSLPLPKTMDEYVLCMAADRSGMSREAMTKGLGRVRSRAAMVSRGP
jgi:signal recognition particle GTPase